MTAVINPFKRVVAESYFPGSTPGMGQTLVSWALKREFNEPGPYTFTLYRGRSVSETLAGAVVCGTAIDQPWIYDYSPQKLAYDNATFYKVTLTYPGLVTPWETDWVNDAAYFNHRDWLLAREICRKENLILRKKGGTRGWLFKRRVWGDPCPRCLDKNTGQVTDASCPTCYGTSIDGGYYLPFEYWFLRNPSARETKLVPGEGVVVANLETARGLAWQGPEVGDIWVQDRHDNRFRVIPGIASIAQVRGVDLALNVPIKLLPGTDVAYTLDTSSLPRLD